jgi:hypothetical protein
MQQSLPEVTAACGYWQSYDSLENPTSQGSCFPISSTHVVTNYHVAEGGCAATVSFAEGTAFEVSGVVALDKERDLAIAELYTGRRRLSKVRLADRCPPVGSDLFAVGHPSGLSCTISRGIVSAHRSAGELERFGVRGLSPKDLFLQTDVAISPGSSGGPIIIFNGSNGAEAIAVSAFGLTHGQGLNFGVPSEYVRRLYNARVSECVSLAKMFPCQRSLQRTNLDHSLRLCWVMAGCDGGVSDIEQEVIANCVVVFIQNDLCTSEEATRAIDVSLADYRELADSQIIRESVIELAANLKEEYRQVVKHVLKTIAEADDFIDDCERDLWRLIEAAW